MSAEPTRNAVTPQIQRLIGRHKIDPESLAKLKAFLADSRNLEDALKKQPDAAEAHLVEQ